MSLPFNKINQVIPSTFGQWTKFSDLSSKYIFLWRYISKNLSSKYIGAGIENNYFRSLDPLIFKNKKVYQIFSNTLSLKYVEPTI